MLSNSLYLTPIHGVFGAVAAGDIEDKFVIKNGNNKFYVFSERGLLRELEKTHDINEFLRLYSTVLVKGSPFSVQELKAYFG